MPSPGTLASFRMSLKGFRPWRHEHMFPNLGDFSQLLIDTWHVILRWSSLISLMLKLLHSLLSNLPLTS